VSFGEFMGLAAVMATIVAVFGILASAYRRRLQFLERKLQITAGETAEKAAQYAARNSDLEQRLRVLERIATSGGDAFDVSAQIEALRGDREALPLPEAKTN
jgi:ABC-type phosphate transport system auxiliary subunit